MKGDGSVKHGVNSVDLFLVDACTPRTLQLTGLGIRPGDTIFTEVWIGSKAAAHP